MAAVKEAQWQNRFMELGLEDLARQLAAFAEARDWDQFHSPKNLAMALAGEAGELAATMQWLTTEKSERDQLSDEQVEAIEDEMADVLFYLVRLAQRLEVDLGTACANKLSKNEERYSVAEYSGSSRKAPQRSEYR